METKRKSRYEIINFPMITQKHDFFFCPASDYLNQHNETGSHGQISYQFLKHLANNKAVKQILAVVILSLKVDPVKKLSFMPFFVKSKVAPMTGFDSLFFYFLSFLKFWNHNSYRKAKIVHHLLPFSAGRSFNLFFLLKKGGKKYVLGPIIGPHIDSATVQDEEYVFQAGKSSISKTLMSFQTGLGSFLVRLFGFGLNWLSIRTMRAADLILFSDNHALNYHKKYLLGHSQKVAVLDTGIDTEVFKPPNRNENSSSGGTMPLSILFVGRLTIRKGCKYLILAIAEAISANPKLRLLCQIHGTGPLLPELKQLVNQLGIEKCVVFLGTVASNEDIVARYQSCDIVCLPALSETFTVTKEALCCGKPVIVTNVCSNAERITHGFDGYVVPPRDPSAIAEIILKIDKDRNLLNKMSVNALKSRERFDWKNIVKKYLILLSEVNHDN